MKIITVGALKGGVGKTNFVFNLSSFLVIENKKRVLTIDLDPQGNLTHCFKIDSLKPFSSFLFLENKKLNLNEIIFNTDIKNLDIIPTNIESTGLDMKLVNEISRERILINFFQKNYELLESNYDYIIIDTNPSLNITNTNAYSIAHSILLICDNSIHSLRATNTVINLWDNLCEKLSLHNNIKAVILSNFDHLKISQDFKSYLKESNFANLVINQEIRKKQSFKAGEIDGIPAIMKIRKSINPYFEVTRELQEREII